MRQLSDSFFAGTHHNRDFRLRPEHQQANGSARQNAELRQRIVVLVAHVDDAVVQVRRGATGQQQRDDIVGALLVRSHQVGALRGVQIGDDPAWKGGR